MSLTDNIHKQQSAGFTYPEIRQNLLGQGFSSEEINAAFNSYQAEQVEAHRTRHPLLSNKFTPLVLLVLHYLLFFHLIPGPVAADHYLILSTVGGVLMIILSFWTFAKLAPGLVEQFPIGVGITSILTLFAFGALFISKATDFSANDLKENGVVTTATVVDRTRIPARRGKTICSITVAFLTKENAKAEADIDVTESQYESFSEGMELPVLYSSQHPEIAAIAYPRTLEQYGK